MRKKKREQEKKSYEKKTAEDVYQIERKANFNEGKSQSRTTTRNKKKDLNIRKARNDNK